MTGVTVTALAPNAPGRLGQAIPADDLLVYLRDLGSWRDARKAELVKLRYFAGLTQEQTAEALGIGVSTADRDWSYARAWLFREMGGGRAGG